MRRLLNLLIALASALLPAAVHAAHTQARLRLNVESARPGETIMAGVHLKMDPGWHTYWKNSGASGTPTTIDWKLPPGVRAGEIQWPVPEKMPPDDLVTYIYEHEVVLLVPLTLASNLAPGTLDLRATISWLECEQRCVPGSADVMASLTIGAETKPSDDLGLFVLWHTRLPQPGVALGVRAFWKDAATADSRSLVLEWSVQKADGEFDFFPDTGGDVEVQGAVEKITGGDGKVRLQKLVNKFQGDWPKEISGVLVQKSSPAPVGYSISVPIESATITSAPAAKGESLWKMLCYAFLGGLILNVMPCVLPVIALKILGFVSESKSHPGHVRKLGLVYALGVLASFLVLAALVISVKAAGHRAGWGMQFSNPQFVVFLTTLVTLVALNLFGLFEVTLSSRVMGAAGGLSSRQGMAGAFFNGVLATVLATPCTAPFLGAALGFAFAQSAAVILLIFAVAALGLASPYVILSWQPAWLKFLPKPGLWMERFKIAMGFPMLATALWLFSLVTIHYGDRSWWLGIFLVFVASAAWVFGQFVQRGSVRRGLAAAIALVVLAAGYGWALESKLRWRTPVQNSETSGSLSHAPEGYSWQRWSPATVAKAREEGRPVVVDFTAKWCLTCNISVAPAFESRAVIDKLKELNAVALVADYTLYPADITEELARFDRTGVPLVLVYPADKTLSAAVLPEPLPYPAPYAPVILEALNRAKR